MIPACFATLLWSFCVVASHRSVRQMGEIPANFWRMVFAVLCMGLVGHSVGVDFQSESFGYLFCSGLIGFGLGDLGLYYALTRIGSRLTILFAQCGAVPFAFCIEWIWLGNLLSWGQAIAIIVIMCGIALALLPGHLDALAADRKRFTAGIIGGIIAAIGQAGGGVLSRIAYQSQGIIDTSGSTVEGILNGATAGYQRLLGGLLFIALIYLIRKLYPTRRSVATHPRASDSTANKTTWIIIAALTGPVIGIAFFQWALIATETAIVQSIVALTPIVIIPFAYWFEGERPKPRSIIGGIIAVCGVLALAFF